MGKGLSLCFNAAIAAAALALAAGGSRAQIAVSTFDTNTDGWTVHDIAGSGLPLQTIGIYTPTWNAAGGSAGGGISMRDPSGYTFWFEAPGAFVGDVSDAYGGRLTYDLRSSSGAAVTSPGVWLVGAGMGLFHAPQLPDVPWSSYDAPLDPGSWRLGNYVSGRAPTGAEMLAVLGSLDHLLINGDWVAGSETTYLDNVALWEAPTVQAGAVPEPGTLGILGAGAISFAFLARRRRNS
ncbi:MAG: PEP-CTERM sorting domain-containing protein [Chthonomonadales bacterium]|nr:PEP-CTERM sorting domain-containing protein [Chthonomonadales bacterium]